MEKAELLQMIRSPESLKLEFKEVYDLSLKDHIKDEIARDILAMANTIVGLDNPPGYIILGVSDKFQSDGKRGVPGLPHSEFFSEKQLLQIVNARCHPKLPALKYSEFEVEGKIVGVIEIPPSPYVHETVRELVTKEDERRRKTYPANVTFVRRIEAVEIASRQEIETILQAKRRALHAPPISPRPQRQKLWIAVGAFAAILVICCVGITVLWGGTKIVQNLTASGPSVPTSAPATLPSVGVPTATITPRPLPSPTLVAPSPTIAPLPTPTPSPTPEEPSPTPFPSGIAFEDDFETRASDEWEVVKGRPIVSDGAWVNASNTSDTLMAVIGHPAWQNYEVWVDYDMTSSYDDAVAVLVRYQDADNFVAFYGRGTGNVSWQVVRDGGWREVVGTDSRQGLWLLDHRYHIVVQDDIYTAYMDGELISTFTDDTLFPTGRVGVWIHDDDDYSVVRIDDFKVELLP